MPLRERYISEGAYAAALTEAPHTKNRKAVIDSAAGRRSYCRDHDREPGADPWCEGASICVSRAYAGGIAD